MRFTKMIACADTNTSGSPTRVVLSGIPRIPGKDVKAKIEYFRTRMDHLRTALVCEPRGYFEMVGAIMTEPTTQGSDFGLIFMDNEGYMDICGHAFIGAVTAAVELGLVESGNGTTRLMVDTAAGQVSALAETENGIAKSVTIENVPSFFAKETLVEVPDHGKVPVEISYGGNFFAIVNAEELNLRLELKNLNSVIKVGMQIKDQVNKHTPVKHPILGDARVECVELSAAPMHPDADFKNAVVYGFGQVDREPCVTGTCAKMAALHAHGKLKTGTEFVHEGILGTLARGKIVRETRIGDIKAIIPAITESAYITGIHSFFINPDDPLKYGFVIR
jgi:proline racemase